MESLKIEIGCSKRLIVLLILMHLGAVIIMFPLTFSFWLKSALILTLLVSMAFSISRYGFMTSPKAISLFWEDKDGMWCLQRQNGELLNGVLCADSLITTVLAILNFKCEGHPGIIPVVICSDAVDGEFFRRLRVKLVKCVGCG